MRARWMWVALVCASCGGEVSPPMPDAASGLDAGVDAGAPCDQQSDCDDGVYCNGLEECVDNACRNGEPPCAAAEECHEAEGACRASECSDAVADPDTDRHRSMACGGDDCDDGDGNRYPGNPEICDAAGHDEDCRPDTYGFVDADMDGDPDMRCCNGDVCGTDCDDMRPSVSSRVPEVCGNGVDDDCDATVDEGVIAGFADPDGDGYGDDSMPVTVCPGTAGFATMGGDCDEGDISTNPGAPEMCNHGDEDCDGLFDESAGAAACTVDVLANRCSFTCLGRCDWTRVGYLRMGGTAPAPDTSPGAAYLWTTDPIASFDVAPSTIGSALWSVRYLATPGFRGVGAISVVLTPRPELGPDSVDIGVSAPGGIPALMTSEFAIVATADVAAGRAVLIVYEGARSRLVRTATSTLPASCLATTTAERQFRVTLRVADTDITASLESVGCAGGTSSVAATYTGFWTDVYGERPDYARYWLGAIADSDNTGMLADLRQITLTRDAAPDRGNCVSCPSWACMP